MQKDMHYYGTYCLARAAGIKKQSSIIIASASEYVDDATMHESIHLGDARSLMTEMTAHKMIDYHNADPDDQRQVWLPFHFLPGGKGKTLAEKLICRKDSAIARDMVAANLKIASERPDYALQLVGITAHVYADTFAHYGFIGANHPLNAIKSNSIQTHTDPESEIHKYIWKKANKMWNNILSSALSDAFPLGHGAAVTFPDRPYLTWDYIRKVDGKKISRNNFKDFMEGAEALYSMFSEFLDQNTAHAEIAGGVPWSQIKPHVEEIFRIQGSKDERADGWKKSLRAGHFTSTGKTLLTPAGESLPAYKGEDWTSSIEQIQFQPDQAPEIGKLLKLPAYNFYRAARAHRHLILTDILPAKGILAA